MILNVKTSAAASVYTLGVVRNDTGGTVVAPGTSMSFVAGTTYQYTYTLTEPSPGLAYTVTYSFTINGLVNTWQEIITAASDTLVVPGRETPREDISDLWAIYRATKAQLEGLQTLKSQVMLAYGNYATLSPGDANDDFLNYSRGGEGGGESWSRESLLDRLGELTKQEAELTKIMMEQRSLAIKASPGFNMRRIPQRRWR